MNPSHTPAHVHPLAAAVLITWRRNGAYATRLVGDLAPEQYFAQPVAGRVLNHPAWVFSHLNIYTRICTAMLRREPFGDPIDAKYGQKSEVSLDPSDYIPGPDLLASYNALHTEAEHALMLAAEGIFATANPLERWRAMNPTVGDMIVTLMVKHESSHLGQLSAWRRALGLARVPM